MRFNVCLLDSNIHTQCFSELAESIAHGLQVLGHEASLSHDYCPVLDVWNIVLGARPGAPMLMSPENTVLFNGEQARPESMWSQLFETYRRFRIWDYSQANANSYPEWGLPKPSVVRPGWSPVLENRIAKREPYAYDVSFVGSMNERRSKCLDRIEALGLKVLEVPFGLYGKERDLLLGQAPVCVNIHYYSPGIFESVRCSYLIHNRIRVVSEKSLGGEGEECCECAVYDELPERVLKVVREVEQDPQQAADSLAWMRYYNILASDLEVAVEGLAAPRAMVTVPEVPTALGIVDEATGAPANITLAMIVKNEAQVIVRCLQSVKHLLSGWVIVDTGSTDGTQEVIREFMKDLPGAVYDRPWKEFDGSRTEALDLAREHAQGTGWLLMFDADEFVEMDGEARVGAYDCYNALVTRCMGCAQWERPFLMRASKPWYFRMPRHEGLYCAEVAPTAPRPLSSLLIMSTYDGARATEEEHVRYLRDAKVLEGWLREHPHDSRCAYYLAQSYKDAAKSRDPVDTAAITQALKYYLRRADMAGYAPETFSAALQAANCMQDVGFPKWRVMEQLLKAYEIRPTRAEPLYLIAVYYREQERYVLAELYARRAAELADPHDNFVDCDPAVYVWKAKDELATSLTYLNGHAEARDIYEQLLKLPTLPPVERERIVANYEMCLRVAPPQ